jgi:hypothetical protein
MQAFQQSGGWLQKRSFAQRAGRPSSIDLFLSLSDLAIMHQLTAGENTQNGRITSRLTALEETLDSIDGIPSIPT